jgi:hypothetical protein
MSFVMTQVGVRGIKRNGTGISSNSLYLASRNKQKLSLIIYKAQDKSGTGDAVNENV